MNYNYISIEGNIGAGKTSLATMIARDYNAQLILEQFEENSFLPKFYKEPDKYAFPLEMSFLAERYQQLKDKLSTGDLFSSFTIADYFIDKSVIFAKKTLKEDEFTLYSKLFNIISQSLPKPDLLVYLYLNIGQLQGNIHKRAREYELNIQDEYLTSIQNGYFEYLRKQHDFPVLIIDTNQINFVNNKKDYEKIISIIDQEHSQGIHRIVP